MEADYQNATLDQAIDDAIFSALLGKRHVVPARVSSFDVDTQTIIAEPMIAIEDNDGNPIEISPVADVPILQLGGGDFVITFNPVAGDPCLLLVSDRCIDDWHETNEKRIPADFRQNEISDSLAIVGFRTKPQAIKNILPGVTIRTIDGTDYVNLNNGTLTLKTATKVLIDTPNAEFTGNVQIDKNLHVVGGTTFDGDVDGGSAKATFSDATIAGHAIGSHVHTNGNDGNNTGTMV